MPYCFPQRSLPKRCLSNNQRILVSPVSFFNICKFRNFVRIRSGFVGFIQFILKKWCRKSRISRWWFWGALCYFISLISSVWTSDFLHRFFAWSAYSPQRDNMPTVRSPWENWLFLFQSICFFWITTEKIWLWNLNWHSTGRNFLR